MLKLPASIYIVNPATDSDGSVLKYETAFPALAPLALGTWLQQRFPEVSILARDANILGQKYVLDEIVREKPYVVAVSALGMNYQNCLQIANCAKEVGSTVVFGNDHAAQLSYQILATRRAVDYVVCSEYGELSFELLLRHLYSGAPPLEEIPFLTFRKRNGEIAGYRYPGRREAAKTSFIYQYLDSYPFPGRKAAEIDSFPITNRKFYPGEIWHHCLQTFKQQSDVAFLRQAVTGVTTMNRARGCSRSKRPCSFCNILSLTPYHSSPEVFWAEIAAAHEDIAATVFYEVCDSFTSFPTFIKKLLAARPSELKVEPELIVYGQALEITRHSDIPSLLRDLGVYKVNLGLESGCDITLRHMKGPLDSVLINRRALELLRSAGLRVYSSFVLGSEAESPQTLVETCNWIISILDDDLVDDIELQPVLPYIGNREGALLSELGLFQVDPENPDWPPDTDVLSRLFVSSFSSVDYGTIRDAIDRVIEHARDLGKMGCSAVMRTS
jgi:radical SAM superfamily enzyme YgiQ (UPF0313 family)